MGDNVGAERIVVGFGGEDRLFDPAMRSSRLSSTASWRRGAGKSVEPGAGDPVFVDAPIRARRSQPNRVRPSGNRSCHAGVSR